MKPRIDFMKVNPKALQPMLGLGTYLETCSIDARLLHLIKVRASQINGCAYCIDMHTKEARADGETEQRLYGLNAWRETPYFNNRERAALAWTDALTLITDGHVPDAVFAEVREQFSEAEMVDLALAVVTINSWNRVVISFRPVPGTYQTRAR
jgi:AhpD family alkylhydroperoxidase